MAKRTYAQLKGDQGELEAATLLLDTGGAINNLTSSDYGWDLHLQLPDDPFVWSSAVWQHRSGWLLSARTVHVQVKNATRTMLKPETVFMWSKTPAPTSFLLERDPNGPFYSTPDQLAKWARRFTKKHPNYSKSVQYKGEYRGWDVREFATEAYLWTSHPLLMRAASHAVRPLLAPSFDTYFEHKFRDFLLMLANGVAQRFPARYLEPYDLVARRNLADVVAAAGGHKFPHRSFDPDKLAESLLLEITAHAYSLTPAVYSISDDPAEIESDLAQLIEDLVPAIRSAQVLDEFMLAQPPATA